MDYTKRRNLNRGFMKLEVWQRGMDLFELAFRLAEPVHDFKLKSQFTDAAQSTAANISEGYGRRTLPEYLQFLYFAKGSLAEALTRAAGLWKVKLISDRDFETFDPLHYEVENKLLALISSLESKQPNHEWRTTLPQSQNRPMIHQPKDQSEVLGEFNRIAEAERHAASSVTLLDLVQRWQPKQIGG